MATQGKTELETALSAAVRTRNAIEKSIDEKRTNGTPEAELQDMEDLAQRAAVIVTELRKFRQPSKSTQA